MSGKANRPQSILGIPPAAKPPCQIESSAIISDRAVLIGKHPITIGAHSVIHPYATLDSSHGPLVIGSCCIVSERSHLGTDDDQTDGVPTVILDHVTVDTGARITASEIGDASTVGPFAHIAARGRVGRYCKIAAKCSMPPGSVLPDFTVVLDNNAQRVDTTTATREDIQKLKIQGQRMHVDTLRRLIPSNIAKWT